MCSSVRMAVGAWSARAFDSVDTWAAPNALEQRHLAQRYIEVLRCLHRDAARRWSSRCRARVRGAPRPACCGAVLCIILTILVVAVSRPPWGAVDYVSKPEQ
ncbi:hypothetical protein EVAR_87425_1 [Eumeta japonica]|uniref:Uncharacterized protein n=1 Tax=Eumeta variegata TaxID=151549 RepID=A0A4C1XIQ4_EUMVA|nr:hypothetical protein EVAR_87425_1 [Eumeta japonica]